jgi:hypothetical protein
VKPVWLLAGLLVLVPSLQSAGAASPPLLRTLSNRADLVSGGDVLLDVTVPSGDRLARLTAAGRDVTGQVRRLDGRHWRGVVSGLPLGRSDLVARTAGGGADSITVVNHPLTGPVFAGPQVQPWVCDTASHGLGPPRDASCSTPAVTSYVYKNAVTGSYEDYDPAAPPAAALVAQTTTEGGTVPYIVRVENGVMDRGLYTIAVLRASWNHKLGSPFGGSCNPRHQQEGVDTGPNAFQPTLFSVLDDSKLSRGFMVAHNNLGNLGSNCNDVVAAESLMMLKEHITEQYGRFVGPSATAAPADRCCSTSSLPTIPVYSTASCLRAASRTCGAPSRSLRTATC